MLDLFDLQAKVHAVYVILLETYGNNPLVSRREPMHELISTMLSHRTTGANESKAYKQMRARFPTWDDVMNAPVDDLAQSIEPANFAPAKAVNIKEALSQIKADRGDFDLAFLRDVSVEEGMKWLTNLRGVGLKTASLVLLFCFAKPILPVDTHVHRVSQRLGLIAPKLNPTQAHEPLWQLLPHDAQWLYNYHVTMLRHGQRICTFNHPRCRQCPLLELCPYGQAKIGGA